MVQVRSGKFMHTGALFFEDPDMCILLHYLTKYLNIH